MGDREILFSGIIFLCEIQRNIQLTQEKEKLENQLNQIREVSEEQAVTTENLKNELMTLKAQLEALDTQISRDREKLLKLREDKKILLEKASWLTHRTITKRYIDIYL